MIAGTGQHQSDRRLGVDGQEHAARYALNHAPVTDLDVGVLHRPKRDRSGHRVPGENLRQPDRRKAEMAGREA